MRLIYGTILIIPWFFLFIAGAATKLSLYEISSTIVWYYFPFLISFISFPVFSKFFDFGNSLSWSICRVLSPLFFSYFAWLMAFIFQISISPLYLSLFLAFYVLVLTLLGTKKDIHLAKYKDCFDNIILVESLFSLLFFYFLFVQLIRADIHWGEKPMDFNLLSYGIRTVEALWSDPWFFGEKLHYYFFGYMQFSFFSKISSLNAEISYPLSVSYCASTFAVSTFLFLSYLQKSLVISYIGATLVSFSSTLKSFYSYVFEEAGLNFNFFWSLTRIFKNSGFAEFPSWSFLFADLHPHVMGYSYTILFLFLVIKLLDKHIYDQKNVLFKEYVLLSFVYGSLFAINGWDFIFCSIFVFIFYILSIKRFKGFNHFFKFGLYFFATSIFSILIYLPIYFSLKSGKPISITLYKGEVNDLLSYIQHFAGWIIAASSVIAFCLIKRIKVYNRYSIFFTSLCLIILFSEKFVVIDRINTIFKFFNLLYILFAILAFWSLSKFSIILKSRLWFIVSIPSLLIFNILFLSGILQLKSFLNYRPFGIHSSKGFHGLEYLSFLNPNDYKTIQWINNNIIGTPLLIERYGDSFDSRGARFSSYTGLPSFLGWTGHVQTRGQLTKDIFSRKNIIDLIYSSNDPMKIHELLLNLKVNFIIVGPFERANYSNASLMKFKTYKNLFTTLYEYKDSVIYGVGDYQRFVVK